MVVGRGVVEQLGRARAESEPMLARGLIDSSGYPAGRSFYEVPSDESAGVRQPVRIL